LCLKGEITTDRDRKAAAWLKSFYKADQYVDQQMTARKLDLLQDLPAALRAERKNYDLPSGVYGYTQFEMTGGAAFWQEHAATLKKELDLLSERSVLSIIDLDRTQSILYSNDQDLRDRLETVLDCRMTNHVAVIPALMRKQIAKLLES
jgi:hypothetical protein